MNFITTLGLLAAVCTTFSFVPQVIHTLRTNDTRGISLGMYSMFCLGILLWLCYGVMISDWPIILANAVTICLAGCVLFLKLRHTFKGKE